jgi:hypothetical protein
MMRILLAALLVAIILIAGCAAPQQPQAGNPTGGTPSGGTPSGGNTQSYPECITSCNSISADSDLFTSCKIGCAISDAEDRKDPSRCEEIKPYANASLFYIGCLSAVADKLGNTSPCDRLTNSTDKDWCIVMSADKVKDPKICDGVVDTMMKGICLDDTNNSK